VFGERASRVAAAMICIGAVCWLCLGFLVGVQRDEEEYRHTIPSTMVAAEAMQRGELAFWTSQLGLGAPQPFGQSLSLHPLTLLLGVIPVVTWIKLLYTLHLIAAASGMWLLARRLGASRIASAFAVATYVLASPAVEYALVDFWPSTWPVYTLAPLVVLAMLSLCEATSSRSRLRASLGLGLVAGVLGSTGHQGYLIVFIPACLAFLLPHLPVVARTLTWWLLVGVIAAVLTAPVIVHLYTELNVSPDMLTSRVTHRYTLTLDSLWDVFARPFAPAISPGADWSDTTLQRGVRLLAFGGPAAVLAILFAVRVRARWDLILGMLIPLVPLSVPGLTFSHYFSATFLFRDPVILFAAPSAALALDWLAGRSWGGRRVAVPVLAAQLALLAAGAWPFIDYNLAGRAQPTTDVFVGEQPVSSWLRDRVRDSGARVYYSAGIDELLWTGQLNVDGLWRNSMFYRGVPVINGQFAFVSIDVLSPQGEIRGLPEVTRGDTTLLDIAGAGWVLALDGEELSPRLVRRAETTSMRGHRLVLYELPSARGAAFVDPSIRGVQLPLIAGCAHDRLFCRDFAQLTGVRPDATRVDRAAGRVAVSFDAAREERLLLVGEMHRSGWQVAEPGAAVEPLLGALVGVRVPAGATRVTLRFRPPLRAGLAIAAWTTMFVTAAALFATFLRRRPARGTPAAAIG
jgi:hypothetical protein